MSTYVHVANFAKLASEEINDEDKYKGFIRMVHIYQREVGHIVEDIFGGVRIHFQGAKVHTLFYRPIDDGGKIATKAILLQLVLKDFVSYSSGLAWLPRLKYNPAHQWQ